eukprot:465822_1
MTLFLFYCYKMKCSNITKHQHQLPTAQKPPPITKQMTTQQNQSMQQMTLIIDINQPILRAMRWGLIPSFSKDGTSQYPLINANRSNVKTTGIYNRLIKRKR